MSRARPLILAAIVAPFLGLIATAGACNSTDTTATEPLTGVTLPAETLTSGLGCGTAPGQVFKYMVLIYGSNLDDAADASIPITQKRYDQFLGAQVYDCFTDGTFLNLGTPGGVAAYSLDVYTYDQPTFAASDAAGLTRLVDDLQFQLLALNVDLADGGNGSAEIGVISSDLATVRGLAANYTTTCFAEQLQLVQTLAVCKPLEPEPTVGDAGRDAADADAAQTTDAADAAADAPDAD